MLSATSTTKTPSSRVSSPTWVGALRIVSRVSPLNCTPLFISVSSSSCLISFSSSLLFGFLETLSQSSIKSSFLSVNFQSLILSISISGYPLLLIISTSLFLRSRYDFLTLIYNFCSLMEFSLASPLYSREQGRMTHGIYLYLTSTLV